MQMARSMSLLDIFQGNNVYLTTVKDALNNVLESHAYDSQGRATTSAIAGNGRDVAPYGALLLLDPGTYSLRFSVVDTEGKRASVVRPVTVSRTIGTVPATSDLIVGNVMSSAETPRR